MNISLTRKTAPVALAAFLVLVIRLLVADDTGLAQGTTEGLFSETPTALSQALPRKPYVIRQRAVTIHMDQLRALSSDQISEVSQQVTLNLFPDATYVAVLDEVIVNPSGSYIWEGHIQDAPLTIVRLVVRENIVIGSIMLTHTAYRVQYVGDDIHVIQQIDASAFPPEGDSDISASEPASSPHTTASPSEDDGSIIDVLVVYTAQARTDAGGRTAIESLIDQVIGESNLSYRNSAIVQRLRLTAKAVVTYTESGSLNTDLNPLTTDNDNIMDDVHTLRNAYAADLVLLLVGDNGDPNLCGLAWTMTTEAGTFEPNGFAVVRRDCAASPQYSFPHELAHNMGAQHDRFAAGDDTGAFNYSFGYVDRQWRWRTIMAYQDECQAQTPPQNCARIEHFSNPNVSYGATPVPTGVQVGQSNAADNAQTLNNTRDTVANFREGNLADPIVDGATGNDATGDGTSSRPFQTVTAGAYRVRADGMVWIRPGNYPETPMINVPNPPNADMQRVLVIDRPMTLRSTGQPGQIVTIGQ